MKPEIEETIRKIKTDFRLSMNGVASKSMREGGLGYKLIWGIELPRMRMIADGYEKNHDLAQELWKDDVRESKILATMLQPVESFYPEIADIWVERMPTWEMADIACMNLFQHLPYAADKAFQWLSGEGVMEQYCGWTTLARIFMRRPEMNDYTETEFFDQLQPVLLDAEPQLRRASMLCAQKYIAIGEEQEAKLRKVLSPMAKSGSEDERAIYEQIFM